MQSVTLDLPPSTRRGREAGIVAGFVSTYLPTQCGIATFCNSLVTALERADVGVHPLVAAVSPDMALTPAHPSSFAFDKRQAVDYYRAADCLNESSDVAVIQHEYGIFGGPDGELVLDLTERLRVPFVSTLHTVLPAPGPNQRRIVSELGRTGARVVVMSQHARQLLADVYGVPLRKIEVIPHGVPYGVSRLSDVSLEPELDGRTIILTVGLLSRGKGIENMLRALSRVVTDHPEALYVVVGATHPQVRLEEGEAYRDSLRALAGELGVSDHLLFIDRFVSEPELIAFLRRADIYVTPYHSREQSCSGTLAYAYATGNAIVATPFPYARELLTNGLGLLAPHGDDAQLADRLDYLLSHPDVRADLQKRTFLASRGMMWPEVARQYARLLREVVPAHRVELEDVS